MSEETGTTTVTEQAKFLGKVLKFCKDREMPESTFGRLAVNDGSFVNDLREGRSPTMKVAEKVEKFMRGHK